MLKKKRGKAWEEGLRGTGRECGVGWQASRSKNNSGVFKKTKVEWAKGDKRNKKNRGKSCRTHRGFET